jgi:hypothetical protein
MELVHDQKIKLRDNLQKIEQHELIYIFNMLKTKGIKFTQNIAGIYIRDDHIDNETLIIINEFVEKKLEEHKLYHGNIKNE